MYKMMIAGNDQENINVIAQTVQENFRKIEVADIVHPSTDFLKSWKEIQPDMIFISVMGDVNGLELVKRIREEEKKYIPIVIYSDYSSHELINEAIQLGIDGYLVAPLKKNNILHVTKTIMQRIKKEELFEEEKREKEALLNQVMELSEYGFVYSVLFNGKFEGEVKQYREMMELDEQGYILNVEFHSIKEGKRKTELEERSSEIYRFFKGKIEEKYKCIIGQKITNRVIVFISIPKEEIDKEKKGKNSIALAKYIKEEFKRKLEIDVSIGIGKIHSIENIHNSYEEALYSLRYDTKKSVAYAGEIRKSIKHREYIALEDKMLDSIKFGKSETVQLFSSLIEMLRVLNYEDKKNKILELLVLSCHAARMEGENEIEYINYEAYLEEVENVRNLEAWAYSKFEYIIKAVRTSRNARKSSTVKEAMGYIELHYREDISLEEVANYVGVSPQHFSKIFKDETGYNYVEWISNLRINVAKRYLNQGDKNIKEICYLVGYKDPNYFSRIFKKIVGITPTEYTKVDR